MAKTKFLSKVLAVLLALSMLCSTGVFANADAEGSTEPEAATLASLSYTTELAFPTGKTSKAANARGDKRSLFTGGFYQPELVEKATEVEFKGTTIDVTVPYGSEVVKFTGTNSLGEAVAFNDVNLINNNGTGSALATVGDTTYTINVAWAKYNAAADAAGNMVYDVKYKIKDLHTSTNTYYNIIPTKLVLTEKRIPARDVDAYDEAGTNVIAKAGEWYLKADIADSETNLPAHNAGAALNTRRISTITFENWVRAGLITATGAPGAALDTEVSNEVVDEIAYNAMNDATTLVVDVNDFKKATSAGTNADMAPAYSFKVAQDSIVYVAWKNESIGEGWTHFENAGRLKLHEVKPDQLYTKDGEELTAIAPAGYATHSDGNSANTENAFYRYAKAGDEVTITPDGTSSMPPIIIVRPINFKALAPEATLTYKVGDETNKIDFDEDSNETTITLSWGTTDAISVAAAITKGAGSAVVSDAITLSADNKEGTIEVVIKDWEGNPVTTYLIKFKWGEEPKENAYLTIKAPTGSGSYTVECEAEPTNEKKNHTGRGPFGPTLYRLGEKVTLTATPDEGYVFKFWEIQSKNKTSIYNKNLEVTVEVPNKIVLHPVFDVADAYTVVFLGYQNEICDYKTVNKSESDSAAEVDVPKASPRYGYKFVGWKCEEFPDEEFEPGEKISVGQITKDLTFEAVYELDEDMQQYTLTVTNGVIDGVEDTTKEFGFNERVVVKAKDDAEGEIFQFWADKNNVDEAISYSRTYAFYMIAADRDLVAVYGPAKKEIEPAYTLTVSKIDESEEGDPIFGLFAERRIPKGYTVVQSGIVAGYEGNKYGFKAGDESVTLDSFNKKSTSKYQNNNGIFFVQLQLTQAEKYRGTWYANAYITYKEDSASEPTTVYSPKVEIAVDEDEAPTDELADESTEG